MQPVSRCQFALQGKGKKPFIDKHAEGTAHFHLVHRSQRDPKAADPEAPQRVLIPGELGQRKGTSQIDSMASSRAWLEEQDLAGFDADPEDAAAGPSDDFADMAVGTGDESYNYGQHLRTIKSDGLFIRALPLEDGVVVKPRGPASVALSSASRTSRLSRASIQLRTVSEEVFESAEQMDHSVTGLLNDQNVVNAEDEAERIKQEMDPELWDALHWDEDAEAEKRGMELDEDGRGGYEEIDDDFVLQATRGTELIGIPERRKKGKKAPVARAGGLADWLPEATGEGDGEEDDEEEDDEFGDDDDAVLLQGEEEDDEVLANEANLMRATRGIGSLMAAQSGSSGSGGDDDAPHFLPAATFAGAKAGYVFQRGAKGVGYYREGAGSTAAGGGGGDPGCSVGAGSSAAVAKRRNPFNDLFDDDDAEEELLNQQRLKPNKTSSLKLPPPPAASRRAPRMSDLDSFPDDDDDDDRVSTVTSSAWTADPGRKQGRLLDERFSKLLSAEYSDDEIGELDQDDPRVIGEEDLEVNARTPERPGRTVFLPASLPRTPARARPGCPGCPGYPGSPGCPGCPSCPGCGVPCRIALAAKLPSWLCLLGASWVAAQVAAYARAAPLHTRACTHAAGTDETKRSSQTEFANGT